MGQEHVLGYKALPCGIGHSVGLLFVGLRAAVVGLDGLVLVQILRITDLVAVDNTDLGIIVRESHVGSQREDKCQKRQCYDNREHDAEFGP